MEITLTVGGIGLFLIICLYSWGKGIQTNFENWKNRYSELSEKHTELLSNYNLLDNRLQQNDKMAEQIKVKELSRQEWKTKYSELSEKHAELNHNYNLLDNRLQQNDKIVEQIKAKELSQQEWEKKQKEINADLIAEMDNYLTEKEKAYKWIAPIMADIKLWIKESNRNDRELIKTKRGFSSQVRVEVLVREKKDLEEENSILRYQIGYIRTLFPSVDDMIEYKGIQTNSEDWKNRYSELSEKHTELLSNYNLLGNRLQQNDKMAEQIKVKELSRQEWETKYSELSEKHAELNHNYNLLDNRLQQNDKMAEQIKVKELSRQEWETKYSELSEKHAELNHNYNLLDNRLQQNDKIVEQIKAKELSQQEWEKKQKEINADLITEMDNYLTEKEKAYKWIAPIMADIKLWIKESNRNDGELIKTKRGFSSQARVEVLIREKKDLEEENSILRYQIGYIRTLFPSVDDMIEYNEYDSHSDNVDNPSNFLSKEEYNLLSDTEKNKRALEYYKNRKKHNWEIGRDFEMYCGYKFEQEGFHVTYFGIEQKLNDLGRDLIAMKEKYTYVVQCKYWSKEKQIHEKHLAQLYGTYIMYKIENQRASDVFPVFITHTTLSDVAKKFAKILGIIVMENEDLGEYPLIKCNVSKDEYGLETKIYHLPLDQQYDKVIIKPKEGDCMAFTIEEAEKKGFRRTYKWHGNA